MKVLDVCEFYSEQGGGVRTYVHKKLESAAALGVEMVVVAPGPHDRVEARTGGRIVWVASPPMPLDPRYHVLWDERAVHRVIAREAPDVIEGSSPWGGGWFAARYPKPTPRAMVFHQDPVAVYPHTLLDRYVSHARIDRACAPYWSYLCRLGQRFDATVVSSDWLAERLRQQGVPRVHPVTFGIDKAAFHPRRASLAARAHWLGRAGAPEDAHLLVSISRHHPEKRLGTLLHAVARLNARGGVKGRPVALVVFGDGPLRPWVERRARRVPHVHVAGLSHDRTQLAQALASADLFLHGSAAETYGLVVAEALCSGLPLVVPAAGGALDLADPGWAETYRPGDAPDCARALERLLRRPRTQLREAAARAREERVRTSREHFDALFGLYGRLTPRAEAA